MDGWGQQGHTAAAANGGGGSGCSWGPVRVGQSEARTIISRVQIGNREIFVVLKNNGNRVDP